MTLDAFEVRFMELHQLHTFQRVDLTGRMSDFRSEEHLVGDAQ